MDILDIVSAESLGQTRKFEESVSSVHSKIPEFCKLQI